MKIMYVDYSIEGHHLEYLKYLAENIEEECLAVLPQYVETLNMKQIAYPQLNLKEKKAAQYLKYMKTLKKIAIQEHVDVIHFLDGDSAMRYFHIGYRYLKKFRTVVTFHHLFPGKLRELSMKAILNTVSMAVVHTDEIAEKIRSYGCENVTCIHYPCFLPLERKEQEGGNTKTLLSLGGTRYDKGLDILLDALKNVKKEYHLNIAGKEEFFSRDFVENAIKSYKEKVTVNLKFLSNEEMIEYLQSADIIVLPYRKEFDGASGPMCDGSYLGKTIIGPNHGSLGAMIEKNHLGYTFESENSDDLAKKITLALDSSFTYDEVAKQYQNSLDPKCFLQKHRALYGSL